MHVVNARRALSERDVQRKQYSHKRNKAKRKTERTNIKIYILLLFVPFSSVLLSVVTHSHTHTNTKKEEWVHGAQPLLRPPSPSCRSRRRGYYIQHNTLLHFLLLLFLFMFKATESELDPSPYRPPRVHLCRGPPGLRPRESLLLRGRPPHATKPCQYFLRVGPPHYEARNGPDSNLAHARIRAAFLLRALTPA